MPVWPAWWEWDLELSSHLFKRMADRDFNEIEARRMLSAASGLRPDVVSGRWIIATRHQRALWEVIVKPTTTRNL
ncbi:MAG: hypothetical protein M3Z05_01475 [Gemmatimonadota bacterium]|nr:hypothetical protein [Gemmatimonadota bacterium]